MERISLKYEDIMERALRQIKVETDSVFDMDEKERAETAMRIAAIIDFMEMLNHATIVVKKDFQE